MHGVLLSVKLFSISGDDEEGAAGGDAAKKKKRKRNKKKKGKQKITLYFACPCHIQHISYEVKLENTNVYLPKMDGLC